MPDLSLSIAAAISALGLTPGQAAKWIDPTASGYKTAHKRLTRYISNPPMSIRLLVADLDTLGLEITISRISEEKK